MKHSRVSRDIRAIRSPTMILSCGPGPLCPDAEDIPHHRVTFKWLSHGSRRQRTISKLSSPASERLHQASDLQRSSVPIQHAEAHHLARFPTGTGKQPLDPDWHIAEQGTDGHGITAFAGQQAPATQAAATAFTHHGHLRRHDCGLKRRCQLLRLGKPKPQVSQAGRLIALDDGPPQSPS
jgi:hypothetical protein